MHSLVKDLMTTSVVTVQPTTPFKEIVARLARHKISAVPVVDHDQRVLGMVSEADLLLKEEFPEPDKDIPLFWTKRARLDRAKAAAAMARDLMTMPVVSIAPEATAAEAPGGCTPPASSGCPWSSGAGWSGSSAGRTC
jgi:CBS domain-containing protein